MPLNAVMLDLETLSSSNRAAIVAIGAFKFDMNALQPFAEITEAQKFYCTVNPKSCQKAGLEIDGETVMWWLAQAEEARKALTGRPPMFLLAALNSFLWWLGNDSVGMWGNGATFDNVILRNAYEALDLKAPWPHRADACYRTIKNCFGANLEFERVGVQHNALDDAISQGLHLQKIFARLGPQPCR